MPITSVVKGRGDPRNIIGVILAVENGHQIYVCPQRFLSESDINSDSSVSLRQANKTESEHGGHGFVKCNCNGSKRCACFKNNVLCNSRCHNNVNCLNK